MAKNNRKTAFMDALMAEPIRLPGAPQIIVTRDWAFAWLKKLGYETDCRNGRFNTVDYMVFSKRTVDESLTDLTQPWAVAFIARMEADLS